LDDATCFSTAAVAVTEIASRRWSIVSERVHSVSFLVMYFAYRQRFSSSSSCSSSLSAAAAAGVELHVIAAIDVVV